MTAEGDYSQLADAMGSLGDLAAEQVRCYRIDADRRLVAVETERLPNQWPETFDELWIDIQAAAPSQFSPVRNCLLRSGSTVLPQVAISSPLHRDNENVAVKKNEGWQSGVQACREKTGACEKPKDKSTGDGQWIAGSLNPMLAATLGFLRQMLRSASNPLESAPEFLDQLAPIRCIQPHPLQDRR
jgi:hypothetical protein